MLKKFRVRNYKNFKNDIEIDFGKPGGYKYNTDCLTGNMLGKILLYGRNATGKTNFGDAITDIRLILGNNPFQEFKEVLNADSDEVESFFYYEFQFDNDIVSYEYTRDKNGFVASEKLLINEKPVFRVKMDPLKIFIFNDNPEGLSADSLQIEEYIKINTSNKLKIDVQMQVPFLRFIFSNCPIEAESPLKKLSYFVNGMMCSSVLSQIVAPRITSSKFVEYLAKEDRLSDFEDFLNAMGVDCELEIVSSYERYELFFKHKKLVPFFETASSGTRTLYNLYKLMVTWDEELSFLYLDEFDAFYHFEMSENILCYLKERYPDKQIIMTTHNTNLMTNDLMRPDCIVILSHEGKITQLNEATERELREGHNLEKLYISGEFEEYE